ncbi:hypothetical protein GH714_033376 [Hevea brasiliensis]|uniref:PUB 12/19-like N-terminal domain-containing protein n=1 Tax=Hevea brasiliensis TaxID=3981 RepID=A0A6A6L7P5_HEVBR|nr:hypothetical protein GH714_033376 [Hevea brasiliensis]
MKAQSCVLFFFGHAKGQLAHKFCQITEQIEAALSEIPYDKLDLSEEVQEQIELVHAQLRRAKERPDSPDSQLDLDLALAQREKDPDPAVLKRLSEKLELKTISDLKKESLAFHELVISSDGDRETGCRRPMKDYASKNGWMQDTRLAQKHNRLCRILH